MFRYQRFASVLRATGLALLFTFLAAGCASAQSTCFDQNHLTKYLSDLLGTTCTVGTSTNYVTYTWNAANASTPGYVCHSDSGTTCPDAAHITVGQKDLGCSNDDGSTNNEVYTLLFVQSDSTLSVNSNNPGNVGHWIDIAINGSLTVTGNASGTHNNFNWPHWDCATAGGQTGSGVETNMTTLYCGLYCTGNGVSTIRCDANSKINDPKTCYDDSTATDYSANYAAPFTGSGPYYFTIAMTVNSPSGSASNSAFLYSVGTHFSP
jgi:hypothetical protein